MLICCCFPVDLFVLYISGHVSLNEDTNVVQKWKRSSLFRVYREWKVWCIHLGTRKDSSRMRTDRGISRHGGCIPLPPPEGTWNQGPGRNLWPEIRYLSSPCEQTLPSVAVGKNVGLKSMQQDETLDSKHRWPYFPIFLTLNVVCCSGLWKHLDASPI